MNTKIFKIDPQNVEKQINDIKSAAELLSSGELVVFPTETVYGLGGDARNPDAAKKIYAAKGRPSDNPLIVHIADPSDAEEYTYTNALYYKLAKAFMPGPLTVILRSKDSIPKETRGGLDTVAIRCPSDPIANSLIKFAGVPIAAPSANLSGSPSPTNARHVIEDMDGRVAAIIDGGDCDFGLESTIVKIEDDESLTLLRPGKITVDELSLIANITVAAAVTGALEAGQVALSPGMKYRHYAPKSPLVLLDGDLESCIGYIKKSEEKHIAVLCYSDDFDTFERDIGYAKLFKLGYRDDMSAQAHSLFALLRDADKFDFEMIYAPLPVKQGVGLALYNRLIRAAAHRIVKVDKDG